MIDTTELAALIALILAVAALAATVVIGVLGRKPAGDLDREFVKRLELIRVEHMRTLEARYAEANQTMRAVVDVAGGLISALAKLTPGKADDTLADFIQDIQTPGQPTPPQA